MCGLMHRAEKYRLSFTTGGLFLPESLMIAQIFLECGDWKETTKTVIEENKLQTRTRNTAVRLCREVSARLQTLNEQELTFLVHNPVQDQRYVLWIAVCRRYKLIYDFVLHVLQEQFLSAQKVVEPSDFDAFVHRLSEIHAELASITESTYKKLRAVLFRMLKELEFVSGTIINPVFLSPNLLQLISDNNPEEIALFPYPH